MLNFGFGEILIVAVLAIVVVGPDRLPEMLRFLGKQYGKVMRTSNELRRAFMLEADREEAAERAKALRARREQARKRADEARQRALERARLSQGGEPVPRADGTDPVAHPDPSPTEPGEAAPVAPALDPTPAASEGSPSIPSPDEDAS